MPSEDLGREPGDQGSLEDVQDIHLPAGRVLGSIPDVHRVPVGILEQDALSTPLFFYCLHLKSVTKVTIDKSVKYT